MQITQARKLGKSNQMWKIQFFPTKSIPVPGEWWRTPSEILITLLAIDYQTLGQRGWYHVRCLSAIISLLGLRTSVQTVLHALIKVCHYKFLSLNYVMVCHFMQYYTNKVFQHMCVVCVCVWLCVCLLRVFFCFADSPHPSQSSDVMMMTKWNFSKSAVALF